MLRLLVLPETTNMPARTSINQAQSNPLLPRRIPQILQISHHRLDEPVWSGSRCGGWWSYRHTGCFTDWADPYTGTFQGGLARVPKSQHLQENIPASLAQASVSSAESLANFPGGLCPDLPKVHFRCLLIAPVGILVVAPLINVGASSYPHQVARSRRLSWLVVASSVVQHRSQNYRAVVVSFLSTTEWSSADRSEKPMRCIEPRSFAVLVIPQALDLTLHRPPSTDQLRRPLGEFACVRTSLSPNTRIRDRRSCVLHTSSGHQGGRLPDQRRGRIPDYPRRGVSSCCHCATSSMKLGSTSCSFSTTPQESDVLSLLF